MIPDDDSGHPVRIQDARSTWVSTPRHWVITAVVIGALMLLATWPVPTLVGLGAATAVRLLLAGIRAFLGRRRAKVRPPDWAKVYLVSAADSSPADDPLTDASTDGSKGCTGCVGCGTPDCIERRADGPLTGDDDARPICVCGFDPRFEEQHRSGCPVFDRPPLTGDSATRDRVADAIRGRIEQSGTAGFVTLIEEPAAVPFGVSQYDLADVALAVMPGPAYEHEQHRGQLAYVLGFPGESTWPEMIQSTEHVVQEMTTIIAQRTWAAEQAQRKAEAVTEVWRANAELAVGQRDQARATVARVEAALDGLGPLAERHIRIALDAPLVQADTEQPVSDPQPLDETGPDTCQIVHVDGGPVLLRGDGQIDQQAAAAFEEIIRAAKRKHAAEHPNPGPDGILRDEQGHPICTCTFEARCPACLATDGD